jgi:hypothetical protein
MDPNNDNDDNDNNIDNNINNDDDDNDNNDNDDMIDEDHDPKQSECNSNRSINHKNTYKTFGYITLK